MKLILTDNPKYCPTDIPEGYLLKQVDTKSVKEYDGNVDVEVILCSRTLAASLKMVHLPSCRLVQLFSVGYDDLDLLYFKERNIPLCNASGIYDNALAEYVVYAMLLYTKRFHRSLKNRMFRIFRNYHYMTEIAGKTVGILGCGRIGSAVARRLSGFGVRVVGYAKTTTHKEGFDHIYNGGDIVKLFSESDYIVNVLPHDESTVGLIDDAFLKHCKQTMTFINIGRESVFKGDDFYQYLKRNKDVTAILDMFDILPNPITNKYRRLSNVLVMPRIAAISQESGNALKLLLRYNMEAVLSGKELKNRLI